MPTDADLLAAIVHGDREAFAELFRRRQKDVFRFALHMTGSPSIADDVTQDVFLTVMREAGRYEAGRATVVAWLCGIARNHVYRRLEGERRLQPLADEDDGRAEVEPGTGGQDPLAALTRAEGIAALKRAILTLPVNYREAVVLCDLQELSYVDAAAVLGCAIGTVRSRLHRGRALLSSKLTTDLHAGPDPAAEGNVTRMMRTVRTVRTLA